MKHYIFCQEPFNTQKGGVVGYLSQLYLALNSTNRLCLSDDGIDISFLFPVSYIRPIEYPSITQLNPEFMSVVNHDFSRLNWYHKEKFIKRWNYQFRSILPYSEIRKIDFANLKSFHIHGAYNFAPVYNTLCSFGLEKKIVKIISTHNPFKPMLEDIELISRDFKWRIAQKSVISYVLSERDRLAYQLSDAIVFPCEESMELYYQSWPEFQEITKHKKIYFCETGSAPKKVRTQSKTLRTSLNIPEGAVVFLYLGRFIKIRGFDLVIEAAKRLLATNKNIYFLIVGERTEVPIKSNQWIQVPYTNYPGDYLAISDVVLAPNRGSYFDLSMIEALASAKPLLCAEVGGYKWLRNKTSGVFFFKPEKMDDFVSQIIWLSKLTKEKLNNLGQVNQDFYMSHLTPDNFARNYTNVICKIYDDFNIDDAPNLFSISPELTFKDGYECLGLVKPDSFLNQVKKANRTNRAHIVAKFLESRFGTNSLLYRTAKKIYWNFVY